MIVPARSVDKARTALAAMARTEIDYLDLADPTSIDAFAARFLATERPVHMLINNVGRQNGKRALRSHGRRAR